MGEQEDPPGQEWHPITHGLKMGAVPSVVKKMQLIIADVKAHEVRFINVEVGFIQLFSTDWNEAERNWSWHAGSICPRGTADLSNSIGGTCTVVRPSAGGSIWSIVRGLVIVIDGWFTCLQIFCRVHLLETWSGIKHFVNKLTLQERFSNNAINCYPRTARQPIQLHQQTKNTIN